MPESRDAGAEWLATPPWPDPLFKECDVADLLTAGKSPGPHHDHDLQKFASDLNGIFRSAYLSHVAIESVRQPPPSEQREAVQKIKAASETLLGLIAPQPASLSLNPLNLPAMLRLLRYVQPDLNAGIGAEIGFDLDDAGIADELGEYLSRLTNSIDSALPPKIAAAVLRERAEQCSLNIPQADHQAARDLRESARQEAASIFLLTIAPAVLNGLAIRAEASEKLIAAAGDANAGRRSNVFQHELFRGLAPLIADMFPSKTIASSKEQCGLVEYWSNKVLEKLFQITSERLPADSNDRYGARTCLGSIIDIKLSTKAQYLYNATRRL